MSNNDASSEREQLERSAEMFEMILQTAPDDIQNYVALKDIYRQLGRKADFKRVVSRLADIYLASGQGEQAAKEYADVLEVDSADEEAATKLREMGYAHADVRPLKAEEETKSTREAYNQKLREVQEAEKALAEAGESVREPEEGREAHRYRLLQQIEEESRQKEYQLKEEYERWRSRGSEDVFNHVAQSLKQQADKILETDRCGNITKSVKEADKVLASTNKVFQKEWRRISQERKREFEEKLENLKREKEARLRSAEQQIVSRAEQDRAAAERALAQAKRELRALEHQLREEEKSPGEVETSLSGQSLSRPNPPGRPENEAHAPSGSDGETPPAPAEPLEEPIISPAAHKLARDEVGKTLGAILVQHGLVTRQHLEEAITKQQENHRPIGQILVESGHSNEEDIINALVAQAGVPYLPLANYQISDDVARSIPKELALRYALMPADRIGGSLLVAMGIPLNKEQKREVQRHVAGLKIQYFVSSWADIKAKHERYYV